mgnify:CR=1 FL=1
MRVASTPELIHHVGTLSPWNSQEVYPPSPPRSAFACSSTLASKAGNSTATRASIGPCAAPSRTSHSDCSLTTTVPVAGSKVNPLKSVGPHVTVRVSKKYHAHDEKNEAKTGEIVRIQESAPLSKQKRWTLVEKVDAAKA